MKNYYYFTLLKIFQCPAFKKKKSYFCTAFNLLGLLFWLKFEKASGFAQICSWK